MCLLAEVAYEHDEDFCSHLPLLFHAIMTAMDSQEPLVYEHAQQALVNLLYSLSARHLELHMNSGALLIEHQQVTSLIKYLQSMRGRRLWAKEDVSLRRTHLASSVALAALVNAVTDSIFFESDLRERWAAEALKWMLECNSRHMACRSHQVPPRGKHSAAVHVSSDVHCHDCLRLFTIVQYVCHSCMDVGCV